MCMIDYADGRAQFYSERTVTARKRHTCGECDRAIEPGEQYQYVSGVWDGDFDTHKTCSHCVVGQKLLSRECGGWLFGGVHEDLLEHTSEVLSWSMQAARLVIGMRRKWKAFNGGLMRIPTLPEIKVSA